MVGGRKEFELILSCWGSYLYDSFLLGILNAFGKLELLEVEVLSVELLRLVTAYLISGKDEGRSEVEAIQIESRGQWFK